MRQGTSSSRFEVQNGAVVFIRVVAVGGAQHETVTPPPGPDPIPYPGPGNVYRFVASGSPGDIVRVGITCAFAQKYDPPALYRFEVWEESEEGEGGEVFRPPDVYQPDGDDFPTEVSIALEFVIVE